MTSGAMRKDAGGQRSRARIKRRWWTLEEVSGSRETCSLKRLGHIRNERDANSAGGFPWRDMQCIRKAGAISLPGRRCLCGRE